MKIPVTKQVVVENNAGLNDSGELPKKNFVQIIPKKKFILSGVLLLVILTLVACFLYAYRGKSKGVSQQQQNVLDNQMEENINYAQDKFLYTQYPNFDNLTLSDLPVFSDVRNVSDYKGNLIVMGVDQLIELDSTTGEIVRTSIRDNPDFYSATKLGDLLYVADNGNYFEHMQPKIYVVNLDTGQVVKTLQGMKEIPYDLTNVSLHSYKTDLWIAAGYQVIRYDTVKDNVTKSYSLSDIGYKEVPTCDNSLEMVDEEDTVKVVEFACKNFISTYSYETDAWTIQKFNRIDASKYINRNAEDFGLKIPKFYAITSKIDNEYFALTDLGIYKIARTSMPQVFYDRAVSEIYSSLNFIGTMDGKSFIIVSMDELRGPSLPGNFNFKPISSVMAIKKVDTVNKTETDLLKNNVFAQRNIGESIDLFYELYDANATMIDGIFRISFPGGSISVNSNTNEVSFNFGELSK